MSVNAESMQKPEHCVTFEELLEDLLADGVLADEQAEILRTRRNLAATGTLKIHPITWLSEQNLRNQQTGKPLDIEALTEWLADHATLPYFRIDPLKIDVESVTAVVSQAYASRFGILPVEVDGHSVTFATAEPYQRQWIQEMSHVLNLDIKRVISNPLHVSRYINELFTLSQSVRKVQKRDRDQRQSNVNNVEALVELGRSGKLDANDQHIVSIVDWLLQYAFDQRASDIHLEPRRENGNVRFRIDGVLHTVYEMPTPILAAVTSRIKALARMDIVEKRKPQDGRVKTRTPAGEEVELRLSTMPTAFGEKLVMRIFDPAVLVKTLPELGFSRRDAATWQDLTSQSHGVVLVTGPTGSGKTTTLYSTLKHLARPEVNVCTIEDPIEMVEPSLNQMQVNPTIGLDFASGVRTLLRQDPDIIMIGEIRDLETANTAIQAALTGHLVLSTLHTNDASSAITRLLDLGVPSYLINATLLGVVAQRLVRTLCPHCQSTGKLAKTDWELLTKPWRIEAPDEVPVAVGCGECRNTGYSGRAGVYEMLVMSAEIRKLIKPGCGIEPIRKQVMKQGVEALRISGARKVLKGHTSIEEVLRVVPAEGG